MGDWATKEPYDYNDHLPTNIVVIRLGEIAFICALNDSYGVFQGLMPKIESLPPKLNPIQFLEVLAEFQFINAHLKYRPAYMTKFDPNTGIAKITGDIPEKFELNELDFSLRGEMMVRNIYGSFKDFSLKGLTIKETKEKKYF